MSYIIFMDSDTNNCGKDTEEEKKKRRDDLDINKSIFVPLSDFTTQSEFGDASYFIANLFLLPFKLLWDIIVIIGSVWLEIIWIGFLFGSVLGVVLILIFAPKLFVGPLFLLQFIVNPWPDKE